jgi:hypothetical protein
MSSDIALFPLPCFPGYFSPLSLPAADAAVPYVKLIILYFYTFKALHKKKQENIGIIHTHTVICFTVFLPQKENDVMIISQLISETPGFLAPCEGFISFYGITLNSNPKKQKRKKKPSFDTSMSIVNQRLP